MVEPFLWTAEEFGKTPVREFMTTGLYTVFPESTREEVVRAMLFFKVHRIFVIDPRQGTIEGVITTMDLLRSMAGSTKARKRLRA